ncbi:aspartate--tRNA ligase [Pseudoflavonifractor phocaeensis]|uniref:aspartate--tRNA ligase n=1 Tax=Pseudoflavonifractor phocaeensis TaxID=1870988 RepID=UPI001F1CA4CB|nr:aspartate--tRNA ligase [Pseudoflavonifractor phocaeensis]MCF2662500.1 aspartate--tRNA ligase [Pseudoflavonifractor phocaeensis]
MDNLQDFHRSHYCGDLRLSDAGKTVSVCGWVQRQRDLGGLIFVDLRDRTGLVQLSFDDSTDKAIFDKAASLRGEYVIAATGLVREREAKTNKIATGDIEIYVTELRLLAKAETPPFEIVENSKANDMLRLKYRYLDLRRPEMQKAIATRHKITKIARDYFDEQGFLEIETPILTKSTPEGARDYLVPSRVHPGKFYALPQSPQQYKQLLMLSGFDRYFQIARCFRDEDLRADRQPEFTQIDLEMSFLNEDEIMTIQEGFLKRVFKEVLDVDIQTPFQRMPWREAMDRFGSDKPDLRFGFELKDISDIVKDCGFGVFSGPVAAGGSVRLINIEGGAAAFPRKKIDKLGDFAKTYHAKGLAWARLHEGNMTSSYAKFLTEEENRAILDRAGAKDGDLVLIVGDEKNTVVWAALGALRCEIAKQMGLLDPKDFKFLWVTEFPMFEWSEEENRYMAMHHPFTAPMVEDEDKILTDKANCRARAYDIVLNGTELGGGSIRINTPEMQEKAFQALGISEEDIQERFGHLVNAFKFGAPPHGGLAYGLDRLCMLMAGAPSIRDVIAFPKVQNASDLMMACPDVVDAKQLDDLSIAVTRMEETDQEAE